MQIQLILVRDSISPIPVSPNLREDSDLGLTLCETGVRLVT